MMGEGMGRDERVVRLVPFLPEFLAMDLKIIFAGVSAILGVLCFLPYLRDIFGNTTKPHSYTWFVWSVLQIIVAAAMWKGGAGWAIASSVIGAVFCMLIFLLSLKYGTKNITVFDRICLAGSLLALVAYLVFQDPLLSVVLVTLTDMLGFLPTLRKAYREPGTETASTHLISSVSCAFALLALGRFTLTTALYLSVIMVLDAICGFTVLARSKPANLL